MYADILSVDGRTHVWQGWAQLMSTVPMQLNGLGSNPGCDYSLPQTELKAATVGHWREEIQVIVRPKLDILK